MCKRYGQEGKELPRMIEQKCNYDRLAEKTVQVCKKGTLKMNLRNNRFIC